MLKKYGFLIIPLGAVLLCSLLFFTSLDGKIFDLFLRALPSLTEDDSVLIVMVDDAAIAQTGVFPWPRDVLADAIVFLREMGAHTVAFDLSYLDPSPPQADLVFLQEELPYRLDHSFGQIEDTVSQIVDGYTRGFFSPADGGALKEEAARINHIVREELEDALSLAIRDADAHFAGSLKFFGNSYLALTMVNQEDLSPGKTAYDMSKSNLPYLEENLALNDIDARNDSKTPDTLGIAPPISVLLEQARGAGFVNALQDRDGYRRKVHLLLKYNQRYYPQLTLAGLEEILGSPKISVTNSALVLRDAKIGGEIRDITIPRTTDGSILIKWPKKPFSGYNTLSSWSLIRHNQLERNLITNLLAMESSGFFNNWTEPELPLDKFYQADGVKNQLSQGGSAGEVSLEDYRLLKEEFLALTQTFLTGPWEEELLLQTADDPGLTAYVERLFALCREQHAGIMEIRRDVREQAAGTFSVIGVAATSMTDLGMTTFQENFPNVGLYSTVANMILSEEFLDDAPRLVSFILALLLALALGILLQRLDTAHSLIAGAASLFAAAALLLGFFLITKRYIGAAVPLSSALLTFLSLSGLNYFRTTREKSFLRTAFSRYLAPEVINEIIADPSKLNLGGEKREMTAIFTDIRGFSSISEKMDPADLVNLLNLYLTAMSNIVMEHRGTIDKYEGDAIIAFFGAPIAMEDHAALACRTAVMMKKAEAELNARIVQEGLSPSPLFTRIGINTGEMVVGNMGTPNKMDYTIMGNAVNLAARLEGVNKQYNTRGILISEYTRQQIGGGFVFRSLDRVRVVGINTPLRLYELLDVRNAGGELWKMAEPWEKAVALFEKRNFEEAERLFREIRENDPGDGVAQLYLDRCGEYKKKTPPADWDGVYNLTQK